MPHFFFSSGSLKLFLFHSEDLQTTFINQVGFGINIVDISDPFVKQRKRNNNLRFVDY